MDGEARAIRLVRFGDVNAHIGTAVAVALLIPPKDWLAHRRLAP
jgi:hypothetical protein